MLLRLHLNNIMLPNCWKRCIKYWILCIYSIWEKKISWNKTWDKLLENNPISSEHWIFCNIGRTGELGKHEMCTLLPSVWFFLCVRCCLWHIREFDVKCALQRNFVCACGCQILDKTENLRIMFIVTYNCIFNTCQLTRPK